MRQPVIAAVLGHEAREEPRRDDGGGQECGYRRPDRQEQLIDALDANQREQNCQNAKNA